ncbi:CAP domain-containing protein [Ureibacillus sp. NPDC094379]
MKKWIATSFCAATLFATSFTSANAASVNEDMKNDSNLQNFQIVKWDNHNGFVLRSIQKLSIHNGQLNFNSFEDLINETLKELQGYKGFQINKIVKQVPSTNNETQKEETIPTSVIKETTNQVEEKEAAPTVTKPVETPVKEEPVKQTPNTQAPVPNNNGSNNNTTTNNSNSNQQQVEAPVTKPSTTSNQSFSEFETQVVDLTNAERAKAGLKPLQIYAPLMAVARDKSEDMASNNYFSHTSPTYGSPFDQMRSAGISYRAAGENIAQGQRSPQQVVQAWMDSPGHRQNLLNPSFTHIGVGFVENGYYWTQQFIQL